ncbi:O-methyltransferase MSMEG_5073 [Candidatus Ornithobacterium hominis]|uniref:O-methyltransferase n=1 Tax=Candidatus Ornithobacterium hominis TaxID=2497989 RepID=UPI0024BBECC3|nr:O-methyltransferase [Candidatus Ornithobacterium hominis]CAI9429431.1 O-methyltransferase MSMEG_5073 [Candidatus Ornithobacterium hominis]
MIKADDVLPPDLSRYVEQHSSNEPDFLRNQRHAAEAEMPQAKMISGAYQGRILSMLSQMLQPRVILELGTYTAYATQCLAEGLPEDGKIYTLERNLDLKDLIFENISKGLKKNQIEVIFQDAQAFIESTNLNFDLVFLDANKKQYLDYFELLIPKMSSGGIILADNVLWKGKVLNSVAEKDKIMAVLHEFNEKVKNDHRVEVVMLPIRDGLSLIRKK